MKNSFNKLHIFTTHSFVYGIPVYFLCTFLSEFQFNLPKLFILEVIIGISILWWFFSGVYFFSMILFSKKTRERIFSLIFKFNESDEREEVITSKAAKSTFLLMASVIFIVFFISTSRFGYLSKKTSGYHHGQYTIGHIQIKPFPVGKVEKITNKKEVIKYNIYNFPLSITGLMLLLLIIQFGTYRIFISKYSK